MNQSNAPYVVTDDLAIVFSKLGRLGITPPSEVVIARSSGKIKDSLGAIFPKVDIVAATRIASFLNTRVSALGTIPAVSLTGLLDDRLAAAALHMSRSVRKILDGNGTLKYKSIDVMPRTARDLTCSEQFDTACSKVQPAERIVLIDDVVFSGGTILSIANEFAKRGVAVESVIASVAISAAIPKLAAQGIVVDADLVYPDVHDEVCMRDFIVGAPEGGRNVISEDGYYEAAPYIKPFGDIESWASIPTNKCDDFSRAAIGVSLDIWRDIERQNGRKIMAGELAKPVVGLNNKQSIVEQLERKLAL